VTFLSNLHLLGENYKDYKKYICMSNPSFLKRNLFMIEKNIEYDAHFKSTYKIVKHIANFIKKNAGYNNNEDNLLNTYDYRNLYNNESTV
jgi:hypothetical protein